MITATIPKRVISKITNVIILLNKDTEKLRTRAARGEIYRVK